MLQETPIMGSFSKNGNMDPQAQNNYAMSQPWAGMVNNATTQYAYAQLPMTNVTAYGRPQNGYQN